MNTLIKAVLTMSRAIWKERCTLVNTAGEHTFEKHVRDSSFALMKDLQKDSWKFYSQDKHLLNHDRSFFQTTNFDQIQAWEQQIAKAIKVAQQRDMSKKPTITSWIQKQSAQNDTTSIMGRTPHTYARLIRLSCNTITATPQTSTHSTCYQTTLTKIQKLTSHEERRATRNGSEPRRVFRTGRERILKGYMRHRKTQDTTYTVRRITSPRSENSTSENTQANLLCNAKQRQPTFNIFFNIFCPN